MKTHPPLAWLRTFAYAAEHLSFTQAASALNLTQAAVSKQMKALEQSLNQPLFHRQAHGLQLTEMGRRYLPEVRAALNALDSATEDLFGQRQRHGVQLRINMSYAQWILQPRLPELYALLENNPLEMTHTIWDVTQEPVGGDIDIRYGTPPWKNLEAQRLTRDTLFPACAADIDWQSATVPLIHVLGYRSGWRWYAEQSQDRSWLHRPHRAVDNSVMAYQMAAQGLGVVLARSSFLQHPWAQKHLWYPPAPQIQSEEGFFALRTQHKVLSEAAQTVWDWLSTIHPHHH